MEQKICMSVNQSARRVQLLIGDQDFSTAFAEASNWSSSPLDQSGLIKTSCNITLFNVLGNPSSLDDRSNSLWRVGQSVVINVSNSQGNLVRHPTGALRIISCEYDPATLKLTVRAGCLITVLSFKEPVSPIYANITPGVFNERGDIVRSLLAAAGITNINCPYKIPYPINYPIILQGSYLQTAGAILYSAGFVGWINSAEVFCIKPVNLMGNPQMRLTIGGDNGDELFYKRLQNPEGPREVIRVVGVTQVAHQIPSSDVQIRYGDAGTVDPSLFGTITTFYQTTDDTWDAQAKIKTSLIKTLTPLGLALPDLTYEFPGEKMQLTPSEVKVESRHYEQTVEGKLLLIKTTTYKPQGAVIGEYFKYQKDAGIETLGQQSLFVAETSTTSYAYDRVHRTAQVSTIKYESIGALLAGTSFDWSTLATAPIELQLSTTTNESWEQKAVNTWVHRVYGYKTKGQLEPNSLTEVDAADVTTRLLPVQDSQATLIESSNSGQTVPPAPERHQPTADFQERQIRGEAYFSQYGAECRRGNPPPPNLLGNPYKERIRTYQVEYLTGEVASEDDITIPDAPTIDEPNIFGGGGARAIAQCQSLAQIEGQLLYGRFKGQDLGIDLKDSIFAWEPLMRTNCIEPDGTQRAFALDDAHWYLGTSKALCNFGCIWIGDVGSHSQSVQVLLSVAASVGDSSISVQPIANFIPANTILNLDGVQVVSANDTTPGATNIQVVPLVRAIAHGASTTYITASYTLPYIQLQKLAIFGVGRIGIQAYPYAVTSTTVNTSMNGSGNIALTVLGFIEAVTIKGCGNIRIGVFNNSSAALTGTGVIGVVTLAPIVSSVTVSGKGGITTVVLAPIVSSITVRALGAIAATGYVSGSTVVIAGSGAININTPLTLKWSQVDRAAWNNMSRTHWQSLG